MGKILPLSNPPTLKECSVLNCKNCKENYERCEFCYPPKLVMTIGEIDTCVDPVPEFWGKNINENPVSRLLQCEISDCKICEEDYKICNKCDQDFYLDGESEELAKPCIRCDVDKVDGIWIEEDIYCRKCFKECNFYFFFKYF